MNVDNVLWCMVSGDSRPFTIMVSTDDYISILKKHIYERKKNAFSDIDDSELDLWKVSSFHRPAQTF
jgi:Crinkler effector protein N-terminal domain